MERQIVLRNTPVVYRYKRLRRAKRLTITIRPNASVLVTAPAHFPVWRLEIILHKKAAWVLEKITQQQNTKSPLALNLSSADYQRYKNQAKKYIAALVDQVNQIYQFRYSKVAVRNQGTVWGSCSQRGNLNFNFK